MRKKKKLLPTRHVVVPSHVPSRSFTEVPVATAGPRARRRRASLRSPQRTQCTEHKQPALHTHITYIYSCNKLRASLQSSSLNIFNSWHLETMDLLTCRYPWPSSLAGVYGPANQQADLCHPGPSKPFKVVKSQTRTICPVPKVPKVLQVDGFNGFNGGVVKIWPAFGGVAFAPAASACWVRL